MHRNISADCIVFQSPQVPGIHNRPVLTGLTHAAYVSSLQGSPQIVGTIGYVAPEVLQKKEGIDYFKSDVYSLGLVMYQLMSGEMIFHDDISEESLYL